MKREGIKRPFAFKVKALNVKRDLFSILAILNDLRSEKLNKLN